eukprot:symbB.v1.2.026277.t1/scaffold2600.1/size76924/8
MRALLARAATLGARHAMAALADLVLRDSSASTEEVQLACDHLQAFAEDILEELRTKAAMAQEESEEEDEDEEEVDQEHNSLHKKNFGWDAHGYDAPSALRRAAELFEGLLAEVPQAASQAASLRCLAKLRRKQIQSLKAHWRHGEGAPLHGEPRLAMLVAERGGQWATLASEACMEMANVAELQLAAAEAKVPEIEAKVAEARQQRKAAAEAAAAEAAAAEVEAQAAAMEEAKPREDEVKEKIQGEGCDAEDAANLEVSTSKVLLDTVTQ